MNGALLAEAVDVLFTVCRAIAYWIVALAFTATVVIYAGILTGAWAWKHATRRPTPTASPAEPDPIPHPPGEHRPAPRWADDEQDAA